MQNPRFRARIPPQNRAFAPARCAFIATNAQRDGRDRGRGHSVPALKEDVYENDEPHPPSPAVLRGRGRGEGASGVEAAPSASLRVRAHLDSTRTLTLSLSHGVPRERGP